MNGFIRGSVVLLFILAATRPLPADAAPRNANLPGKVHALFVFDTDDRVVGKSLMQDALNVTSWFSALDPSRIAGGAPVVKTGSAATLGSIQEFCRQLKVAPNDAIFVFLGCHGEKHGDVAHVMRFGKQALARGNLMQLLKARGARLVVLITDSCYGGFEIVETRAPYVAPGTPEKYRPVLEDLFFGASGVVNINSAAPGEFAWNGKRGGIMTAAFVDVCSRSRAEFGKIGNNHVTWQDVMNALRPATAQEYALFKENCDPAMRGFDRLRDQKAQTVHAIEPIGGVIIPAGTPETPGRPEKKARILVTLPADATLFFDDFRTLSSGTEREFETPPIPPDRVRYYSVTAERVRDGKLETVTRRVAVRGGEATRVTFQFPAARSPSR